MNTKKKFWCLKDSLHIMYFAVLQMRAAKALESVATRWTWWML